MKKTYFIYTLSAIFLAACGAGDNTPSSTASYYTGGYDYYYQVQTESGSVSNFSVMAANGTTLFSAPLVSSGNNSYSFNTTYNSQQVSGNVVIANDIFSIAASNWGIDLASSNTTILQSGAYSTICDKGNISPCTVTVSNNNVSITEYASNGTPTVLCSNSMLSNTNTIPNNYTFKCGINGSNNPQYDWYLTSITRNNVPGLLLSEFNGNTQVNNDETDDIAVIQATSSGIFQPSGSFYYTYNGANGSGNPTITVANLTSSGSTGTINNPTIGNCNGQAYTLTLDQYYSQIANGYAYFTTSTNPTNFNLVGNSTMNLMMDSVNGFYVQ